MLLSKSRRVATFSTALQLMRSELPDLTSRARRLPCPVYWRTPQPMMGQKLASLKAVIVGAGLLTLAVGCEDKPVPKREPPPPAGKVVACDAKPKLNNPANVALLPPKTGGYCIDPTGSDKAYGEGEKADIKDICNLFDGECEIYLNLKVKHVVEARYVDGAGSGATIDVYLSKFATTTHAYAMYTKRVVGEQDPAHPDVAKHIAGGGSAALGMGNAMLWRGPYLVELTANDSNASMKQMMALSDKLLPPLVKQIGEKLSGKTALPDAAAALPNEQRLPLGIRQHTQDVLGVTGVGGGAFGYYKAGEHRWRVLSIVKEDVDQAKDAMGSFLKLQGATKDKTLVKQAVRFMAKDAGAQTEWLVVRNGKHIIGIGDEPRVLRAGMTAAEHAGVTLSLAEKRQRIKTLLAK